MLVTLALAMPAATAAPRALVVARAAAPAPATAPEPLLTSDQIRQLFDDGNYSETLKQINRVLMLRGKQADAYDRYDLLMLRGETSIRMKAIAPALTSFADAAREASDDPHKAAVARATEMLLRKSKNFIYTPRPDRKGKTADPIDLLEEKKRKAAIVALFNDEMSLAAPKIEAARDAKNLPPIADAIKSMRGLDALEMAAFGNTDKTKQALDDLGRQGRELMSSRIEKLGKQVDDITAEANELIHVVQHFQDTSGNVSDIDMSHKRGLRPEATRMLKDVIAFCQQVPPNAEGLAEAIGGKKKDAADLVDQADGLRRKAEKTLRADYTSNF
jgi:hypothetical protein